MNAPDLHSRILRVMENQSTSDCVGALCSALAGTICIATLSEEDAAKGAEWCGEIIAEIVKQAWGEYGPMRDKAHLGDAKCEGSA